MESIRKRVKIKEQRKKIPKSSFIGLGLLLLFCSLSFNSVQAQNWNEIFRQNKTQQRYLLEQVAALKVYAGYLKKGYEITSSGLQTVEDLKNGEFNLHQTFMMSLKTVNPLIRKHAKVAEIVELQMVIHRLFNQFDPKNPFLSNLGYVKMVKDNLLSACHKDLEELLLTITSGKLEMGDEERVKRIEKIHQAVEEKYVFTQSFLSQIQLLRAQKNQEIKSINQLKQAYEIND
jgi:hypothetical protein